MAAAWPSALFLAAARVMCETVADVATIGVIGAGSWGTALAKLLAESGHDVTLWAHSGEVARDIATHRENTTYLPGFPLPMTLRATSSPSITIGPRLLREKPPAERRV